MAKRIPYCGPSITEKEIQLVTEAVTMGWFENMNHHLDLFTNEFKDFIRRPYCLPTSSCTAAIHLAMLALGIKPGDEVIVPDISWVASAAPAQYVGAKLVFADVDPETYCLCPKSLEKRITKKTKAIVVVSLLGNMPDMDAIRALAKKNRIPIIEDAAESIGATYRGQQSGTFGDISVFSFNATKLTIAGQGGMLVTNNKKWYEKARLYCHHGIDKRPGRKYYWSQICGFNYNWTNMQAALALAQLRRLSELLEKKKMIFGWYQRQLQAIPGIHLNFSDPQSVPSYWLMTIRLDRPKVHKEKWVERFKPYQIDVRPFFYPISSMPPYKKYSGTKNIKKLNPVSYGLSPYTFHLPSGMTLTEQDVHYVCQSLKEIWETL